MDITAIQQMAHSLILSLAKFDSQAIVREKSEDGAALVAAGIAIARVGTAIRDTTEDGLVSAEEFAKIRNEIQAARDRFAELGVEIVDQTEGEGPGAPRADDDPDPTVA